MRYSLLAALLVLAGAQVAPAADVTAPKTVYLNNVVLEELKQSNPRHYAEAQKVMAAAAELCRPGAPQVLRIEKLPETKCSDAFLKTSYPPKREISFTLDDTRYIALVTMKDAAPTLHPAGQDAPTGVLPAK
jgi:hypothetical protein